MQTASFRQMASLCSRPPRSSLDVDLQWALWECLPYFQRPKTGAVQTGDSAEKAHHLKHHHHSPLEYVRPQLHHNKKWATQTICALLRAVLIQNLSWHHSLVRRQASRRAYFDHFQNHEGRLLLSGLILLKKLVYSDLCTFCHMIVLSMRGVACPSRRYVTARGLQQQLIRKPDDGCHQLQTSWGSVCNSKNMYVASSEQINGPIEEATLVMSPRLEGDRSYEELF
jgi:hypothetical protein